MESKEQILKGNLDNYQSDSFDSFFRKDVLKAMQEYADQQNQTVDELRKEVERLRMILKIADVPQMVIDLLSSREPTKDDIDWAKGIIKQSHNI